MSVGGAGVGGGGVGGAGVGGAGVSGGGESALLPLFLAQPRTEAALPAATTFARLSVATVVDQNGVVREVVSGEQRRTGMRRVENLYPSSASPATQAVTVVVGDRYAIYFRAGSPAGTGSFALTGAATETVAEGEAFTFTAATTTLTCTLSGTPGAGATVQLEENSGASVNAPSEYVDSATTYNVGVAAVKYFATTNGNTFSAPGPGAVTEAAGSAIAGIKGVLIEPQRTNEIPWSNDLTGGGWVARGTATLTKNGDHTEVRNVGANPIDDVYIFFGGFPASARYEPSFLLRKITSTGTYSFVQVWGAVYGRWDVDFSALGSGWERITREHPAVTIVAEWVTDPSGLTGYNFQTASGTFDFDIKFVQIEAGEVSTSPILTAGSAGTRAAETLTFTSPATAGTLVAEVEMPAADAAILGAAADPPMALETVSLAARTTNSAASALTTANTASAGATAKLGVAYDATGRSVCLDGGTVATDAAASNLGNITTHCLSVGGTSQHANAHLRQLTVWDERLSDAELQTETT